MKVVCPVLLLAVIAVASSCAERKQYDPNAGMGGTASGAADGGIDAAAGRGTATGGATPNDHGGNGGTLTGSGGSPGGSGGSSSGGSGGSSGGAGGMPGGSGGSAGGVASGGTGTGGAGPGTGGIGGSNSGGGAGGAGGAVDSVCSTCTAPPGGTAVCSGGVCDFTCGSMKKCGQKCIAATAGTCCMDQDCPAQTGKTPRCDSSTNTCSYACSGTTKPCGSTCIPSTACCSNNDCTTPQTCGGGGTANMCGCTRSATTCNGKCGTVKDNCGANADCGTSACGAGQTCNASNACTCGGKQCTSICCAAPPTGTTSICLNNGTQCGLQCNTGTHSCSAASSPTCYGDTDAQHCGAEGGPCMDCRQANANAICSSGTCANTCKGPTLSCPGAAGRPNCGSWDFESGSGSTEGWSPMISPMSAGQPNNGATNAVASSNRPAAYPGTGSVSLVVPLSISASGTWIGGVGVVICPTTALSVGGYTISGNVYFDGPAFPQYAVFEARTWKGSDSTTEAQHIIMSMAGSGTIATKKWLSFTRTLQASSTADRFSLQVAPNAPWSGTMYLDDIKITGL